MPTYRFTVVSGEMLDWVASKVLYRQVNKYNKLIHRDLHLRNESGVPTQTEFYVNGIKHRSSERRA